MTNKNKKTRFQKNLVVKDSLFFVVKICSLLFIVPYLVWFVEASEEGLRSSGFMSNAIKNSYMVWARNRCESDNRNCYPDLPIFILSNGFNSHQIDSDQKYYPDSTEVLNNLIVAASYECCPFRWWPFHMCRSIVTPKILFDHPDIRRIFERAIKSPCQYIDAPKSALNNIDLIEVRSKPYSEFRCHEGAKGNPYDIVVLHKPNHDVGLSPFKVPENSQIYEATR